MKRIVPLAALAFLIAGRAIPTGPAAAQTPPALHNDLVSIEYHEPKSAKYLPLYQKLKERQILEELDAFLSPLELQGALSLSVEEGDPQSCASPNSYYDMRGTLHLCYSWFYFLENEVAVEYKREPGEPFTSTSLGLMPGVTRAEVIVGGTVSVVLHELGHAIFDIQDIPRFGREEDAADQFAAFLMMQFGSAVALPTIKGTYNAWHHFHAESLKAHKGTISPRQEADEHSINIQRSYNYLCIAYGKDPATFQELADQLLPRARRSNCANEYRQAELAFKKTLLPSINLELMKQVQALRILRPEDLK